MIQAPGHAPGANAPLFDGLAGPPDPAAGPPADLPPTADWLGTANEPVEESTPSIGPADASRDLVLADIEPAGLTAGEKLLRLAYRIGLPASLMRAPWRKAPGLRLLATVANPVPGDKVAGVALRAGHFLCLGARHPVAGVEYALKSYPAPFERMLHGLRWLDDLAEAAPREAACETAEPILRAWLTANPKPAGGPAWTIDNVAARLMALVIHAPITLGGPDRAFRARVLWTIATTARWLDGNVHKAEDRLAALSGWAAITAAGLLLPEGKPRRLYGEAGFLRTLGDIVGDDGGVLSRSPLAQIEAIQLILRLSACYRALRQDPPVALDTMLALLVPPLLGVLHRDGGLANWQGAGAIEQRRMEALIAATGVRTRPLRDGPQWGYQRVDAGRATLIVDAAPPPVARHARAGCASTLAFEFSHGPHRLIVNCGGGAIAGGAIPARLAQGLRSTAAHSTLSIDDANSTAVLIDGRLGAGVGEVQLDRRSVAPEGGRAATRIEASHDGYVARYGLRHRRILLLADDGTELRGEDVIEPNRGPGRIWGKKGKVAFALRFHLGPRVEALLSEDALGVGLALPDGSWWHLRCGGDTGLVLEDSLWCDGQGRPVPTKQVVLAGMVSRGGGSFPWLLKKMG